MLKIYSIYDKKMGTYIRPMFVTHLIEIQRNLVNILEDKKTIISQFPSDHELYFLGEFDEKTGQQKLKEKPEFILNVTELQEEQKHV